MSPADLSDVLRGVFREEHGRVVATLARRLGDLDLAEDATAEALLVAVERWPVDGVPPNPGAWLTTVAGNKALDRIRREGRRDAKEAEASLMASQLTPDPAPDAGPIEDDRLRLLFTCCHPALAPENRVALTLRMLGGLTVAEIAHAFLVPERTMEQRITRAKAKIRQAHIPYRVPGAADLPARVSGVLAALYLVFNEGYLSSGMVSRTAGASAPAPVAVRSELCDEAIRLARLVTRLLPDSPEPLGLLALMLLTQARAAARVVDGELVTLDAQDRTLWDARLIDEGHALVRRCLAIGRPGPYQLQAAIQAVHCDAVDVSMTDWSQVVALYDQLRLVAPSPVVELNRAVAVAELAGASVGLDLVTPLADVLDGYHAFHATRADLLQRLGRADEAREAYDRAIACAGNPAEVAWLARRRDHL
ncbi:RNA polymerase sigma factor [Nocardioides jiangxiensis]|uniref:RNA polymerase sigma factor n=1 Tax=Nocardioides jiangxiensis TaxID=3064524 RepID=A0ABT9AYP2_9ACTN|nr:RNA polymerase sigma factor [Nocardioides sp. WY-20]MDO7867195.1 RNA polymerase sigma factor [Nocardioides sp. WY-20]